VALRVINSGDCRSEHETLGVSKEEPSCLLVESFFLTSRIGAPRLSMAQRFWLEGHDFGSSEVDDGCLVS